MWLKLLIGKNLRCCDRPVIPRSGLRLRDVDDVVAAARGEEADDSSGRRVVRIAGLAQLQPHAPAVSVALRHVRHGEELEDDLAATRTSLRRMIRDENRPQPAPRWPSYGATGYLPACPLLQMMRSAATRNWSLSSASCTRTSCSKAMRGRTTHSSLSWKPSPRGCTTPQRLLSELRQRLSSRR
jgi:hypothetical protein